MNLHFGSLLLLTATNLLLISIIMRNYDTPVHCFLGTAAESPFDFTVEEPLQESRSFKVSWTPPASSADLTGYRIYYSEANDSGSVDVGASTTEVTIDSHKPGVTYSITMLALSPHLPSPVVGPISFILGENFVSKNSPTELNGQETISLCFSLELLSRNGSAL